MTKLASTLPDGHGLDAVRNRLLEAPREQHVGIAIVSTQKITTDVDKGDKEPTAAIRVIEIVHPDDLTLARQILTRGRDRRLGATILPLGIEDEVGAAFRVQSADINTDLADHAGDLDDAQVKALARSLDRPLRHELAEAERALRDHTDWVTLGRARRVLTLAIRRLEENDKNLLRDDDGFLIDPRTGEVVEEDKLTTAELDDMLEALIEKNAADDAADDEADADPELPLGDPLDEGDIDDEGDWDGTHAADDEPEAS